MPVSETSNAITAPGRAEDWMSLAPAFLGHKDRQANAAIGGELEGVGEQVLEHLLQTLRVRYKTAAETRIGVEIEG